MLIRIILAVLFIFAGFFNVFAQTTDEKEKTKAVTDDLRKEAVEFLRETDAEIGTLRSLENRIGFASETAGLMWLYDEKQAAAMYRIVISDFKQLLTDYDTQINTLGISFDGEYPTSLARNGQADKARLLQKFYKAMGVRQQIAMSLSENDPALAFDFYYNTLDSVTNPALRKQMQQRDSYFETQLIKQIAVKNPEKAVEFGRKAIAKGVSWQHVDLLRQIYEKDPKKGAEFAEAVVGKFKDDKNSSGNLYNVVSFLKTGAENYEKVKNESGKTPMFSQDNLRDLADLLAQGILATKEGGATEFAVYSELIEKYAPARAVQIRAKYANTPKIRAVTQTEARVMVSTVPTPTPIMSNPAAQDKERQEQMETMQNIQKLGSKELPEEEREKIVGQARKVIGGIGNRTEKIMALSLLASQVSKAGDKELAAEIMKDAQAIVNPSPKNYQDFMETWFLAGAYSETDPDKAFQILDETIFRLNETIAAFVKVGEFMDVSGEIIEDGEIQVGSFGGSMMSGLMRQLGIADVPLRNLAIADFGKTKALTNKFDRAEVRLMAKMLVLRAILGGSPKTDKLIVDDYEG